MKINVTDRDGNAHVLEGRDGWTVMEILRDAELGLAAECGGACACATCHVYIDDTWLDKLSPPSDDEVNMLDMALGVEQRSRLSCQLVCSEELDGLKLIIAPE